MQRYIGIDVHSETCTIAVMGPSGRKLSEQQVETNGRALLTCLRAVAGNKHVCLEEGTQAEWLVELLTPICSEVVVTQAPSNRGNKSDSIDAWTCAELMRSGNYRRVFKAPTQLAELRAAVRTHSALTRDMVRAKNRIRAVYRARGIAAERGDIYDIENRDKMLRKLPKPLAHQARLLFSQLDGLTQAQQEAEAWLTEQAQRSPIVRRLATAPGIGPVRASQIAATVVTPHRFRTKRQFWSYCGLGIVTRSSADWTRGENGQWIRTRTALPRGLNRNRNPLLKCVFKGAAHTVVNYADSPFRQAYQRLLDQGTKPTLAQLTIARRLAATLLAMWKREQDFDPAKI
jgi:transposase